MQLVLFDIDGTLLRGHGAGARALQRAGLAVCGPRFSLEGIPISGGLDSAIYESAARVMGIADPDALHDAFRARYLLELADELSRASPPAELLPGVLPLLAALSGRADVALGLLTGNYRQAVPLKLGAAGLDHRAFAAGAYGEDARLRHALVPVALERFARLGTRVAPEQVIVVGDTPRDVECALKNGCRCLAVATGSHDAAALHDAGAHRVVPDLSDPRALLSLL